MQIERIKLSTAPERLQDWENFREEEKSPYQITRQELTINILDTSTVSKKISSGANE